MARKTTIITTFFESEVQVRHYWICDPLLADV
ncbi:hypothetical protein EYZ11_011741 [Aspergillus tanneri]|uniref:Uncharacterized protein n=1 Tax=Aspergillus tanneri TaxID=1220188 RepID=A0A4S3J210_9EURO|nr:hypothetical protein EYZ11_011741 [Aspergillus tanneri]